MPSAVRTGLPAAVSILTRPGGRVQRNIAVLSFPPESFNPHPSRRTGATDTPKPPWLKARFNPHPSRRTGATGMPTSPCTTHQGFNPHPSRRTGATYMEGFPDEEDTGFNPHPSRRTGATPSLAFCYPLRIGFNPHPSRRTGATRRNHERARRGYLVSILTRPGGRVQPSCVIAISPCQA